MASPLSISSVDDAIQYGIKNNPLIKAQFQVLEAKKVLPKKLGSLSDPKLGVRLNGTPAKKPDYSFDQKRVFVNQSFPFLGELGRKNELGKKEVVISELDYLMTENKVVLSIQTLYYKLVLNKELIEITDKNNKILENIINIADIKYRSGKTLQANVLKAKVSKGKLEEKIFQLNHQKVMLTEDLKKWLGLSETELLLVDLVYPKQKKSSVPTLNKSVGSKTLMVQKAIAMKAKSDQMVRVEKDRYLPDFSAQVEYWNNSGMDNQYAGQIAMSFPWFNAKNSASVKEAKALSESKNDHLTDVQNSIQSILVTLLSDLETTQETVSLYEDQILKNAELSLSSFQKAFEVDKASFLDYFESEKTLFSLEMDYAKLVNRTHTLQAKINSLFEKGVE